VVQQEAGGALPERGQGRHFAGRHEPLGERDFHAVEADRENPLRRHLYLQIRVESIAPGRRGVAISEQGRVPR
jgi:hypothetical protein